jgi:hypothetical protein
MIEPLRMYVGYYQFCPWVVYFPLRSRIRTIIIKLPKIGNKLQKKEIQKTEQSKTEKGKQNKTKQKANLFWAN